MIRRAGGFTSPRPAATLHEHLGVAGLPAKPASSVAPTLRSRALERLFEASVICAPLAITIWTFAPLLSTQPGAEPGNKPPVRSVAAPVSSRSSLQRSAGAR